MFLQSVDLVKRVAVWIRIPRLPMELYDTQFLWRIGSVLGTMLKVDRLTSIHSRGQYARICVEVNLDKPLKSFIEIRGHKLFLEYEGLHLICFHSGKYRHKANQCVNNRSSQKDVNYFSSQNQIKSVLVGSSSFNPNVVLKSSDQNKEAEAKYGSWMVAASRKPRKHQKSHNSLGGSSGVKNAITPDSNLEKKSVSQGSHFKVLEDGQNVSTKEESPAKEVAKVDNSSNGSGEY